jgi:hypothetical protein
MIFEDEICYTKEQRKIVYPCERIPEMCLSLTKDGLGSAADFHNCVSICLLWERKEEAKAV